MSFDVMMVNNENFYFIFLQIVVVHGRLCKIQEQWNFILRPIRVQEDYDR